MKCGGRIEVEPIWGHSEVMLELHAQSDQLTPFSNVYIVRCKTKAAAGVASIHYSQ